MSDMFLALPPTLSMALGNSLSPITFRKRIFKRTNTCIEMRENDTDYEHLHKYLIDIQILLRNNKTMISKFSESRFCFFYLLKYL